MKNRKLKKTLVLCFCSSLLLWTAFRFTLNKLCGVESQGMILAAGDDEGNLSVVTVDKDIVAGSEIC